jgi:hypothetical protein
VQRGSPPQADAEGLVVDSPQDEGCPPISLFPQEWGTKGVESEYRG